MNKHFLILCGLVVFACWGEFALAARSYTSTQSPAVGTTFEMGSTQSLTYQITNTSTGGNVGERIYEMRFRISSGSVFLSSTAAPAGWTRTAFGATSVTFRANSWADAIALGGSAVSFTLAVAMRSTTADVSEALRDMRASFTTTTTGPPFTRTGRATVNTPGGWTLKSLAVTSFQITDTLGNPVSAITSGISFQLRMTVKNNSSVTQSVVSNPNPPTATKTGTVTQGLTSTTGSPLSLAPGASGTIIFTYSTQATDNGTIFFTANAQNGATVTSISATSGTLSVSSFVASIGVAPTCQYSGSNIAVTMIVSNGSLVFPITGVTPTLTPVAGAPVTLVSGPTPASIASIPVATTPPFTPGTGTFTWVYQLNSTGATNPFTFSGSATGTRNAATITTPTTISTPSTTRGGFSVVVNPTATNAGSTNAEQIFTVTNSGCTTVNSVAITAPSGWTSSTDLYSLVNLSAASAIETWTTSGTNPVTFTAPNLASQLPLTFSGSFAIVFASTPSSSTTSVFTLRVTDANGAFQDIPASVTVNSFKTGALNDAINKAWREDFR